VATFGDTSTNESGNAVYYGGYMYFSRTTYALSENGVASGMSAYMKGGASNQVVRLALYAADGTGGHPGTLKGCTEQLTLTSGDSSFAWKGGSFTASLTASNYWMGFWFGTTSQMISVAYPPAYSNSMPYFTLAYHATNSPGDLTGSLSAATGRALVYSTYTPGAFAGLIVTRP